MRILIHLLALLGVLLFAGGASAQPNIVVFVADDQPVLDGRLISVMPHVQAIASNGISFSEAFSDPLCCPARAGYSTDVIAAKAVAHIRSAPRDKPLFAWIASFAMHTPYTPAPRHATDARCASFPRWMPANWNESDVSDKSAWLRELPLLPPAGEDLRHECRLALSLDEAVAAVRQALADTGRLDDTVFVYAGDNGMNEGAHRLSGKVAPYETGVPVYMSCLAAWLVCPRTLDATIQNVDLGVTLAAIGGTRLGPYVTGQAAPDGVNVLSLIDGSTKAEVHQEILEMLPDIRAGAIVPSPPWYAVRTTSTSPVAHVGCPGAPRRGCRYHYIEYATGERELYSDGTIPCPAWQVGQPDDACELDNLATNPQYAGVMAYLHERLVTLQASGIHRFQPSSGGTSASTHR